MDLNLEVERGNKGSVVSGFAFADFARVALYAQSTDLLSSSAVHEQRQSSYLLKVVALNFTLHFYLKVAAST